MKVAITGHTQGIGKAIAELYPDHIGFSRSNGYDISVSENRASIISQCEDCDVFINNAYQDEHQIEMYNEIFEPWHHHKEKTIVNICSRAVYEDPNEKPYNKNKSLLKNISNPGNNYVRQCRVININPGWVATTRVPEEWLIQQNYPYITATECARYVKWAIDQDLEIGELSFWKSK